jgi:hypothetical protein
MLDEKEIIYTEAAEKRIDELYRDIKSQVETELRSRKYVPGEKSVEVTGSDVDDLANHMRIVFYNREAQRKLHRDLIVKMYFALGILTLAAGILYPSLLRIIENPIQFVLIATGLLMTIVSYAMYILVKRREEMIEVRRGEKRFLGDDMTGRRDR